MVSIRDDQRTEYEDRWNNLPLELAKILIPALLAVGGSWMAMDHRMSALEGEVRALTISLQEVKTMLGIGVYDRDRKGR
jgi:hypothetical protein